MSGRRAEGVCARVRWAGNWNLGGELFVCLRDHLPSLAWWESYRCWSCCGSRGEVTRSLRCSVSSGFQPLCSVVSIWSLLRCLILDTSEAFFLRRQITVIWQRFDCFFCHVFSLLADWFPWQFNCSGMQEEASAGIYMYTWARETRGMFASSSVTRHGQVW